MEPARDLFGWVGATIDGKYRVDEVIGRGGFGVVYRAHHLGFDQPVAIKCLRMPANLGPAERERFRDMFLAEGRLLHQLSRATIGIVQALDVGAAVSPTKAWTPYVVLEWLEGKTLAQDLDERRDSGNAGRTLPEAVELLRNAARALATAHAQHIAHRDIKPANLFLANVAGREVVKVLDFGIAKVMSARDSLARAFEETGGTLQTFTARYAAPEHFTRRYGATGPWTDVFSFALVFDEVVTGRPTFQGSDPDQMFAASADTKRRPTLRSLGVDTSDGVEFVLARALAVDPRERYPNAGEFWDALESAVRDVTATWQKGAPAVAATSSPRSKATPKAAAAAPRAKRLRLFGTFALVSLAGAASALLAQRYLASPSGSVRAAASASARPKPSASQSASAKPAASVAPSAAPPAASARPSLLSGPKERDVAGGSLGTATLGRYKLVVNESTAGRDLHGALDACVAAGLSLCTEAQWTLACEAFSDLAAAPSWTGSAEGKRVVVRGGGDCSKREAAVTTELVPERLGLCCSRAVAVKSTGQHKADLATTAARVLAIEGALNQRSVAALLREADQSVSIDGKLKASAELAAVFEAGFRANPELVILTESCDIAVQAQKQRAKRGAKATTQTRSWSALCKQSLLAPSSAGTRGVKYTFNATSRLRGIAKQTLPP